MTNPIEEGFDPEEEPFDDPSWVEYETRTAVECLCPKCGRKHMMNFHWIGRGMPRKFCKHCRSVAV